MLPCFPVPAPRASTLLVSYSPSSAMGLIHVYVCSLLVLPPPPVFHSRGVARHPWCRDQVVDADISEESCDLQYMDSHGTERRVGAKTRFEDVKHARVLRISRKSANELPGPAGSPHAPPKMRLGNAATRRRVKRESKGCGGARETDESGAACLAPVPQATEPSDDQLLPSPTTAHQPPAIAGVVEAV